MLEPTRVLTSRVQCSQVDQQAVEDRYRSKGIFACIARQAVGFFASAYMSCVGPFSAASWTTCFAVRSPAFEHVTSLMIVIYALWLAVDSDCNPNVVNTDTSCWDFTRNMKPRAMLCMIPFALACVFCQCYLK